MHYVPTAHVRCYKEDWATEAAAKAARTRAKLDPTVWLIAEKGEFHRAIELKETRKNLLSGKEFKVGVNAGYTTCPSSETYWSS
jgi:hypothetical protein